MSTILRFTFASALNVCKKQQQSVVVGTATHVPLSLCFEALRKKTTELNKEEKYMGGKF